MLFSTATADGSAASTCAAAGGDEGRQDEGEQEAEDWWGQQGSERTAQAAAAASLACWRPRTASSDGNTTPWSAIDAAGPDAITHSEGRGGGEAENGQTTTCDFCEPHFLSSSLLLQDPGPYLSSLPVMSNHPLLPPESTHSKIS